MKELIPYLTEKGKVLYNNVKDNINNVQLDGTLENQFGDFWKVACSIKTKQHDLRYLYDDSSREFVEKYKDQLIQMRKEFVDNMDFYVEKCINIMRKCNFKVHYAKTNKEAQDIFMQEIGNAKTIYKSKSVEAKDIGIIDIIYTNTKIFI